MKIPFFVPEVNNEDKKIMLKSLDSSCLTDGPELKKFEKRFAKFTNSRFAVGVSNATSALLLSLKAIGIQKGDEVIIPDMTFIATASAVILSGATPVLADIKKDDLTLMPESVEKSVNSKTKAIIPVHFAGSPCDMKQIKKIAKKNNLKIIEDCAHAIGTLYENKHVGTIGDIGCFSFYPTKNITTLEGGMVITNTRKYFEYTKKARNHGITRSLIQRYSKGRPWDYDVIESGYNFRLDEIRSSLGINQLKRIKKINSRRKKICLYYNNGISNINGIKVPELFSNNREHSCHLYIIQIGKQFGLSRDSLVKKLKTSGITTTVHYKPLHKFSVMRKYGKTYDSLRNSKQVYKEIISLPLYLGLTTKQQNYVINQLKKYSKFTL